MDNNNTPLNPVASPTPVVTPLATSPASTQNSSTGNNNKMIIIFLAGFVIIILAVGGIYMYLNSQQIKPNSNAESTASTPATPKAKDVKDALDSDLEAINVSSGEEDFKSVDQDLQSL